LALSRRVTLPILLIFLTCPLSFANDKEAAALDLLTKSFQQATLWRGDPIGLVAKVRVPIPGKPEIDLDYTVSWSGPDKWRTEWKGGGYSQVIVVSNGQRYTTANLPVPPLPVLELQAALGALDGYSLAGPFSPPVESAVGKVELSSMKIGKLQSTCVKPSNWNGRYCIDPGSARAVHTTISAFSFDYSDYATVGTGSYPKTVRITLDSPVVSDRKLVAEAMVTVIPSANLAKELFLPPANNRHDEFPNCTDLDKATALPRLEKQVRPLYSSEARANRQMGTAVMYVEVGKDGTVTEVKIVATAGSALDQSATDAVRQWKYTPYRRCGIDLDFQTILAINYSLQQ
jgi:TonB family protein